MEGDQIQARFISLEDFDPRASTSQMINSPRSIEACQLLGVDPSDLFVLSDKELNKKLEEEGLPLIEREIAKEEYINSLEQLISELRQVRTAIIDGKLEELIEAAQETEKRGRRKKKRRNRNRRADRIRKLRKQDVSPDYVLQKAVDLQGTIKQEVSATEKAIESKNSKLLLLAQERENILYRIEIEEKKLGCSGTLDIENLRLRLSSINSFKRLRQLETYLVGVLKSTVESERREIRNLQEREHAQIESLSLEDKLRVLEYKMMAAAETGSPYRNHNEKMELAKLKKEIEEERHREELFQKEIQNYYKKQQLDVRRNRKAKKIQRKQELKMLRNKVVRKIAEEQEEEKKAKTIEKLQLDDYKLMIFKLAQQDIAKGRTLHSIQTEEKRNQIRQRKELLELIRIQETEAVRQEKDAKAAQILFAINEEKQENVIDKEMKYISIQERVTRQKEEEEFKRGFQYAQFCMDSEKYMIRKQTNQIEERIKGELTRKVELKKKDIHSFFEKLRNSGQLPNSKQELYQLRDAVAQEVQKILPLGKSVALREKLSKAKKTKKTKKRRNKRTNKEQLEQQLKAHPEISKIMAEEEEQMAFLQKMLEEEQDEANKEHIIEEAKNIKNANIERINSILAN